MCRYVRDLAGEEARLVLAEVVASYQRQVHTLNARGRVAEAQVDDLGADAHGLENLRALVRRQSRYTHLGHDLEHPLAARLAVVVEKLAQRNISRKLLLRHKFLNRDVGHVGADGIRAVSRHETMVVNLKKIIFQVQQNSKFNFWSGKK